MTIPSADYTLKPLGTETPLDDPPSTSPQGRPQLVANLTGIKASAGEWFVVATYKTAKGAHIVLKACQDDKQKTPGAFYMKARKVAGGGSELLAMYPGDPE